MPAFLGTRRGRAVPERFDCAYVAEHKRMGPVIIPTGTVAGTARA